MAADPTARLTELMLDVGRHRDAVREFSLAGYATMVEQHKAKLHQVYDRIREHCSEHHLELPPGGPEEVIDTVGEVRVLDRGRSRNFRFPWVVLCEVLNPMSERRYVVWYEDRQGLRSVGYYTTRLEDARAEFERRT